MVLKIGTRKSKLALAQTEIVKKKIEAAFPEIEIEIIPMSTKGDEILDRSLSTFGGKGVFTKELEEALLRGEIDLAVHSAKDIPMEFPKGLHIGAVLERANPRDVLVTTTGIRAKDLRPGSIIGTSSLRRELQMKEMNPAVSIKLLRGNVQTRIGKLEAGQYDGILLAAAGIERLGIEHTPGLHFEYLDMEEFIPAAGQGILAVETREHELEDVMRGISSIEGTILLSCERKFLSVLGGGCNAPCGAISKIEKNILHMMAMYVDKDGERRTAKDFIELGSENNFLDHANGMKKAEDLGEKLANQIKCGKVYLIGAGPGDKGLITKKGLEYIQMADVLIYDNLVSPSIINEAKITAELIYAGKRAANHHLKQEETNQLLIEKAMEGKTVVRLKGGDPYIFGRGGEEVCALNEYNIPFEVVPGISSSYAVPAYAGIPLTHRNMASSFHVITGHEGNHKAEVVLDYDTLAREEGTLVFMMGLGNLSNITKALMERGKNKDTKVAVVQSGTTARQKKVVGTLENIVKKVEEAGILTPAVTVVGEVVSLEETLQWYGKQKLSGKRVLITGTKAITNQLSKVLSECGAEPIEVSLLYTKPIYSEEFHSALDRRMDFNWIVFTSVNGVEIFFQFLKDKQIDLRTVLHMKFAVIGEGTGRALKEKGIQYDYMPTKYSTYDLTKEWVSTLAKTDKLLLLRAKEASSQLTKALDDGNLYYEDIALYETVVDQRRKEDLNRIVQEMDYITFSSASAIKAFASMINQVDQVEGKIICIGPVTQAQALEEGLKVYETATTYTAEGIRDVILYDVCNNV